MAFIYGSTTVGTVLQDLYDTLTGTGAHAAGGKYSTSGQNGNTVSVTTPDAWISVDSSSSRTVIRSVATENLWNQLVMWRGMPRFAFNQVDPGISTGFNAQTGLPTFSGTYTGSTTRGYFSVIVTTGNTSAGSATGAVLTWTFCNALTGAVVNTVTSTSTITDGTSVLLAYGISITVHLTTGQNLAVGTSSMIWLRGYGTSFTDGVDYMPEVARFDTSQTITISSTSMGSNNYTLGTTYSLAQNADQYPGIGTGNHIGSPVIEDLGSFVNGDWGGCGVFSGVSWIGGSPPASGATYYIVPGSPGTGAQLFSCFLHLNYISPILYMIPMEFYDPVTNWARNALGAYNAQGTDFVYDGNTNAMQTSSSSQASAVFINYFISVKENKIVVILRGDPANNGNIELATVQKFTPLDSTDDKSNWCLASSRGAMCHSVEGIFPYDNPYWGNPQVGTTIFHRMTKWGTYVPSGEIGEGKLSVPNSIPPCNPLAWDGKWWMYEVFSMSLGGGQAFAGTWAISTRASGFRGNLQGLWYLSSDQWASLDELVDTTAGLIYLLYAGTTTFGGSGVSTFAMLEE